MLQKVYTSIRLKNRDQHSSVIYASLLHKLFLHILKHLQRRYCHRERELGTRKGVF